MPETTKKDIPFEEAMTRLEESIREMEEGKVPLEQMIRQYENARKLADYCQKKLSGMKQKIEILTRESAEGTQWPPMTPEETTPEQGDFFNAGTRDVSTGEK